MTATAWAALLAAFSVGVVIPGPDTVLLLRLGLRDRRQALLAAAGITLGNAVWTAASLLGLAALMRALPGALPAMQLLGSAVLIWLGSQSIVSGVRGLRSGAEAAVAERVTDHPLRLGLVTNLSNPKALLFFAALFSQILPPDASWFDRAAILVALTAICVVWFTAYALLTSSRGFQRWFRRATPVIDSVEGAVFVLVAGAILVELAVAAVAALA
jgi:threonine/homoserine/homoserine lactone efflux protein